MTDQLSFIDRPFAPPLDEMIFVGIDPGLRGAIAVLVGPRIGEIRDMPLVDGRVDIDALGRWLSSIAPSIAHATIERAQAFPLEGRSTCFNSGVVYGSLRTMLVMCKIPHLVAEPAKWKKHFHLDRDKERSRALAIQLWPGTGHFERKKDHGRAEAALIARYGAETWR